MGTLDDAIREHLDLKRKHGAGGEEVERQEQEAFGRGLPDPVPEQLDVADDSRLESDVAPAWAPESDAEPLAEPELQPQSEPPAVDPAPVESQEDWEEDEEAPVEEEQAVTGQEDRAERPPAVQQPSEDVLEETPDFLEQTPDQDELWFEQKAPKDFDFG
jgi:hypothetical protein